MTIVEEGPKEVGTPPREVASISGFFLAWDPALQSPVMFQMPGSTNDYLPIFSTTEWLEIFLARAGIRSPYTLKQIDDGQEFLTSLEENGTPPVVIMNPWFGLDGRVRYTELRLS